MSNATKESVATIALPADADQNGNHRNGQSGYANSSLSSTERIASPTNWGDPLLTVMSNFHALPTADHADFIADFKIAVEANSVKSILQTFADWAATAEAYATEGMMGDIRQSRDRFYQEEMGWDIGRLDATGRLDNI